MKLIDPQSYEPSQSIDDASIIDPQSYEPSQSIGDASIIDQ